MQSKIFEKAERKGLPGGPNEMFTYVTGVFSTEGYKNGSPDIDNPFNIIPSGNITMKDVDFPVMGIDNLGNKKMMMPGGEYEFPGDMVFEVPMGKSGIEIKPENRGKFTRWAKKRGMTVKQAYTKVLANKDKYPPSIVKMANFARNAAGWKKGQEGMELPSPPPGQETLYDGSPPSSSALVNLERNINQMIGNPMYRNQFDAKLLEQFKPVAEKYKMIVDDLNSYAALPEDKFNQKEFDALQRNLKKFLDTEGKELNAVMNDPVVDDPMRHAIAGANAAQNIQALVQNAPLYGKFFDQFGIDTAAGFLGSNLFGIGHELTRFGTDDRPLKVKLKESYEDIYNNFVGSVEGLRTPDRSELTTKLYDLFLKGNLKSGNISSKEYQKGGEQEIPTQMLDEVVVTAPEKKRFLDTTLGKILTSPIRQLDNAVQILGIPGSIIAEGIEGIGGKGDGRFNLKDIIPDFNKNIFQEGAFGKTPSQVLDVSGVPGFLLDVATDPLTYAGGAGLYRKLATTGAQKAPKTFLDLTKLRQRGITGVPKVIDAEDTAKMYFKIDDLVKNQKNLDEALEMLASGADEIDDFIKMRLKTVAPGTKGYEKLVRMQKDFIDKTVKKQYDGDFSKLLDEFKLSPDKTVDDLAEQMTKMRLTELEKMTSINRQARRMLDDGFGDPSHKYYYVARELVGDNAKKLLSPNAFFRPNQTPQLTSGKLDEILDLVKFGELDKLAYGTKPVQRFGLLDGRGNIGIGPAFTRDPDILRSVLDHELAHAFSLGRRTPLADQLRKLKPKSGISSVDEAGNASAQSLDAVLSGLAGDYRYFSSGPKIKYVDDVLRDAPVGFGDEPMAFAAELKRSMIDRGLISGYDDIITPEILEQASKSFSQNPAGIMTVVDDLFAISPKNYRPKRPGQKGPQSQKYLSNTRLLDFLDPSEYPELAKLLNKIPAVAPIAVAPSLLEEQKEGGTVSWQWKGKTYSGTLIPSMEDANNRYAKTHNGKIKTLPKKKLGGKLRIYKDFINGVYDKSPNIEYVQSVYDKLNRVYLGQAKEANMSVPNYIMTYLVDD